MADAVGALARLTLGRGIPPRAHIDNVVGGGEIEPVSTGIQRDQKGLFLASLEYVDGFLSSRCRGETVEILVGDLLLLEFSANESEVVDERAEDEHFVSAVEDLGKGFAEGGELGTAQVRSRLFLHESGVTAGAAQLGELCEGPDRALAVATQCFDGIPDTEVFSVLLGSRIR